MGLIEKLLRPTPLYQSYRKFLKRRADANHLRLEKKLHPLRVNFYSQFIKPGELVFDVGANVGNRVVSFLDCNAKVVAVEPQPACVDLLRKKFGPRIQIENVGLGSSEGELEMQIASDSTVSSFNKDYVAATRERFKYTEWIGSIRVPVQTLDNLLAKYGLPVFCKIDVEGYEIEVLKGLHQVIPMISFEYCVPELHGQLLECIHYLHQLSPEGQFNYSVGESMKWALSSWQDYHYFLNHLQSQSFIQSSFGDIYFRS